MNIYLGPIQIHLYSWLLLAGTIAGFFICRKIARQKGIETRHIENLIFINVIFGLIGARIFHVLSAIDYYQNNFIEIFYIWNGGLGIFGGIIAGVIASYIYVRNHNLSFLQIADILVPGLALAQAIGRFGNFFNQEAYGYPTDLPWKIFIEPAYRFPAYANFEHYHPVFLYESIFLVIIFFVLMKLFNTSKNGLVFAGYLIFYGIIRFFTEQARLDTFLSGSNSINLTIALLLVACGSIIFIKINTLRKR